MGWTILIGICTTLSWGGDYIHIGDVRGLDIQVQFLGYEDISQSGEVIYGVGMPMAYGVRIKNRTNMTFAPVEIQSSLHTNGVECEDTNLYPGARLPGASLSPVHSVDLTPGAVHEYEGIYAIPDDLCPSGGTLRIRIQYTQTGRINSETLISPIQFQFK